jgi:3-oxoacyl-[acyl-carrier protein] reductase
MGFEQRDPEFSDQVVVITGGSRGIGFATARRFLERGARVGICALDPERLAEAARVLGALGEVEAMVIDIRSMEQIQRFVSQVHRRFGQLNIVVNNAARAWVGRFAAQAVASIDEIIEVNIKGVLYTTRAVLPILLQQKQGTIINVSSGAGLSGHPEIATYCASKFALVGFTESLALEVGRAGIRVYAVCPGRVATDMQVQYSGRRVGMPPERIADAILDLAGRHPPIAPGQCLAIRG